MDSKQTDDLIGCIIEDIGADGGIRVRSPNGRVRRVWLDGMVDDGEPITEDWLLSVGFQKGFYGPWINGAAGVLALSDAPNHQVWILNNQAVKRTQWQTRGELRRLCAALGIPLKETPQ